MSGGDGGVDGAAAGAQDRSTRFRCVAVGRYDQLLACADGRRGWLSGNGTEREGGSRGGEAAQSFPQHGQHQLVPSFCLSRSATTG
jgi:hypothetical protein